MGEALRFYLAYYKTLVDMDIRPEPGVKVGETFKEGLRRVRRYKVRELCLATYSIDEAFVKEYVEPFFTHARLIIDREALRRDRRRQAGSWRALAELNKVYGRKAVVRQRENLHTTLLMASTRRGARFAIVVDMPALGELWGKTAAPCLTMITRDEVELALLQRSFDEVFKSAKLVKLRKPKA